MSTKYNRDTAIENATQLFWEMGYQGSSMRDIQGALDMRPGSIYSAFGSKFGLFSEVVDSYVKSSQKALAEAKKEISPLLALRRFFESNVNGYEKPTYQRQCLLVRTMNELSGPDDEAKVLAVNGLEEVEKAFADVLEAAVKKQELPEQLDIDEAAKWIQQQLIGLRSYSVMYPHSDQHVHAVAHVFKYLPNITRLCD